MREKGELGVGNAGTSQVAPVRSHRGLLVRQRAMAPAALAMPKDALIPRREASGMAIAIGGLARQSQRILWPAMAGSAPCGYRRVHLRRWRTRCCWRKPANLMHGAAANRTVENDRSMTVRGKAGARMDERAAGQGMLT